MAKKRAARRKKKSEDVNETGDDFIEQPDESGDLDFDGSEDAPVKETFAESKGLPANAHAKTLAKKAAKEKAQKKTRASESFYTTKNPDKIVKIIVNSGAVHEVYVGNAKRHKEHLDVLVKQWKKEGVWVEAHEVKEKISAIRAGLAK